MRIFSTSALVLLVCITGCDGGSTMDTDAGGDGGLTPSVCPGPGCMIGPGMIATCALGYACVIPADGTVQCGAGTTCTGTCGNSCDVDCTDGATCDIMTGDSTSSSCDASMCTVTAGESASYDCTNGAMCAVTAGAGSSLNCDSGSTCDFVCNETCGAQCRGDSTCTIMCPDDDMPREFTGEVSCE